MTKEQTLLRALNYLVRHYVGQLENARDRIVSLGGECDPVDVMEARDPHLKQVREVIASVESAPDEPGDERAIAELMRNALREITYRNEHGQLMTIKADVTELVGPLLQPPNRQAELEAPLPKGFIRVAQCAGCGVTDNQQARHFSECPAYPGEPVRPPLNRTEQP